MILTPVLTDWPRPNKRDMMHQSNTNVSTAARKQNNFNKRHKCLTRNLGSTSVMLLMTNTGNTVKVTQCSPKCAPQEDTSNNLVLT